MVIANYKANGELITSAGSGGGAPTDATYITQTANGSLSAEQALASLSTGLMKVTTTTGVVSSVTDSAGLAGCLSDETGSGAAVFATAPTLAAVLIDGASDTTQLTVQGNGTQTALLAVFEKSTGADQITFSNDGGAVFNEAGNDADFRVEGDTDANLIFGDASLDQVGIGTGSPGAKLGVSGNLTVAGTSDAVQATIRANGTQTALILVAENSGGGDLFTVGPSGQIVVNEQGADADSRFEGDTDANLLYIDAGQDAVAVGTNTPDDSAKFQIDSTTKGFLPPRLTTAQRDAVSSPIDGLFVYNSDTDVFNGYMAGSWGAVGSGGSGTTETGNYIKNASFENWENGVSAAPDAWVLTGASATVAREGTIIKHGLYSAKLTRAGTNCTLLQDIYIPGGSTFVRSRQYTFGAWVYATVASRARLVIDDGATVTNSSYHTGGSAWEWLTVTATLGVAITAFKVGLAVDTGDTSGYIDGIAITEAASLTAGFYPSIMPFNAFPVRAVMWHEQALVTAGNALAPSADTNQRHNTLAIQNTPADLDTFTHSIWLRAGTYTFNVLGTTTTTRGIIDWYIDDVTFVTGQDWYSASLTYNVIKSTGSVAVIGDGYHVIKGKINGKNASSSSYFMSLTVYWFTPSAD